MKNDWHHLSIQLSKRQMINLIINYRNIETVTQEGEWVKISDITSDVFSHDEDSNQMVHIVFCRISFKNASFLGHLKMSTNDYKMYKGTIVYQEN